MKGAIATVSLLVVAGLVVFFVLEGRFMLEGGRAPWAVINNDVAVLKEALQKGVSDEERHKAFGRAVGRGNLEAMDLLLDAGADVNQRPSPQSPCTLFATLRFGRPAVAKALLQRGADPSRCDEPAAALMDNALRYGRGDAPQQDLVFILSKLYKPGTDLTEVKALAAKHKLDQVAAWLEHPEQAVAAVDNNIALLPKGEPGSVDQDDLRALCEEGTAVATAAPYKKQAEVASPMYFFERRFETWRWPGVGGPGQPQLPTWWFSFQEKADTQLVACVDAVDKKRVKECHYKGPGGGISVYDATWTVTVKEARTGRVVVEKSFPMQASRQCDVIKFGKDQEGQFPDYGAKLQDVMAALVGGPR